MANALLYPNVMVEKDIFVFGSDFANLITLQDGWTTLVVDAGTTVEVTDARAGRLTLTTGATDNNEAMARSTFETFLTAAGRPMHGHCRLNLTEAATDDANFAFGFASAAGANLLVDDAGGVRTTGNLFLIYKIDGGTVWRCRSRNGTETEDNISLTTAGGAAGTFQDLDIFIEEFSLTECVVTFQVDGAYLRDENTQDVIKHKILYASATEMNFVAGYIKAGGATSETPILDRAWAWQTR